MSPTSPPQDRLSVPFGERDAAVPRLLLQPVQRFLHQEASGGLVLVAAAIVALVWANSPAAAAYDSVFKTELSLDLGVVRLSEDLVHWINDLAMALFFFVVGLEIKREIVHGDLADRRKALLPVMGAFGGMVVPAAIYLAVNGRGPGAAGWGIPMATDIAFAVAVLALCGERAPLGLKVFLLTLAVADDLGAIAVIALFYTADVGVGWLGIAAATVAVIVALRRARVRSLVPYALLAGVLWLAVYSSGVHATIAGVVLGLLTPARPFHPPEAVLGTIRARVQSLAARAPDGVSSEDEQAELADITQLSREAVSPLERLQAALHPWTSFVVLPLFALANAGVPLAGFSASALVADPVILGVLLGLVIGKPLGITLLALLALRVGARLPDGVGIVELIGAGLLAGIGFTVAIFIAGLAFVDQAATDAAKVGILVASVIAAVAGAALLVARPAK